MEIKIQPNQDSNNHVHKKVKVKPTPSNNYTMKELNKVNYLDVTLDKVNVHRTHQKNCNKKGNKALASEKLKL